MRVCVCVDGAGVSLPVTVVIGDACRDSVNNYRLDDAEQRRRCGQVDPLLTDYTHACTHP